MSIAKEMDEAIEMHFEVPADIRRQASMAAWDLHFGPTGGGLEDEGEDESPIYLGFTEACALVSEWCDENLSEVWYDIQSGEVLESEPKGSYDKEDVDEETGDARWVEPNWEDYFHAELCDVKRALFNKELVDHI